MVFIQAFLGRRFFEYFLFRAYRVSGPFLGFKDYASLGVGCLALFYAFLDCWRVIGAL